MNVWYKPRLQSVDNIIKTQVLGGEVSPKQIDAVHEEALDVVLAALNGEAGMSGPDIPFLCAALHFWRDELSRGCAENTLTTLRPRRPLIS